MREAGGGSGIAGRSEQTGWVVCAKTEPWARLSSTDLIFASNLMFAPYLRIMFSLVLCPCFQP